MTTTVDPKKLRICPLTKAICNEKCAWFVPSKRKCALTVLVELLLTFEER